MLGALKLSIQHYLLPNLTLLQRFMVLCAVVLLGAGVVLGERISSNIQRDMVRSTAFNTALYIGSIIGRELEQSDQTLRLTPDSLAILNMLFSPGRLGNEIVAIKVWSKDGEVLFATERELVGRRFPITRDLKEALEGEVHYEVSHLEEEENVLERQEFGQLLEVYAPIRSARGEVIGAAEVYQRVDRIPDFISASRREVWLLIAAALLLLYLALTGIVKQAGETIDRQNGQLRQANRVLEELAVTDFLTHLYNHRHFQQRLTEEVKRAERHQVPLSLIFADLDRFKTLNDTYGHQAGDLALEATAHLIKQTLRSTDIAARYGGEEYAIILPNTDKSGAAAVAERMRSAVEAYRLTLPDGREIGVTISIGIASFPADAIAKETLIEQADQAMYVAKRDGRNRVIEWAAAG